MELASVEVLVRVVHQFDFHAEARNKTQLYGGRNMLWTIFVLLIVLWLLGMVSSYTLGGFIHILLVLAIAAVLIRIIQGRNPV